MDVMMGDIVNTAYTTFSTKQLYIYNVTTMFGRDIFIC